jgi:hypothetical protein
LKSALGGYNNTLFANSTILRAPDKADPFFVLPNLQQHEQRKLWRKQKGISLAGRISDAAAIINQRLRDCAGVAVVVATNFFVVADGGNGIDSEHTPATFDLHA